MKSFTMSLSILAAAVLMVSCGQETSTTTESTPASPISAAPNATAATLTASPNPVPSEGGVGKTTISWNSGSDAAADLFVGVPSSEKIFASGVKGSQEAPWIQPGRNEFRLYTNADHKLLAQLTVTMAAAEAPATSASPAAEASATP